MVQAGTVRFFLTVLPPPVWLQAGLALVAALGAWMLILHPGDVDSAFANILIVQMLATSSGFGAAASRGHFDPLLVTGRTRTAIAWGSAIATALPGLLAWGVVLLVALWLGGAAVDRAFAPPRLAAILIVSGCGWAIGLPLPRLVAGALWLALFVGLLLSRFAVAPALRVLEGGAAGPPDILVSAATVVICPFLLLTDHPGARDLRVLAAALALAGAVVLLGVRYVARRDYTLKEPV